ncbi:DNA-binding transcriptional regulator, PadR family [Sporobacter termitidis DSM 10068]|uniref:DNA-binding transcriptional regulator, PadR family n=1 Tax=Sporobacter termitidis DSM 10068 TaxID=1123282 RepID=A0A1M5Z1P7_9FIRM|nr:PadR family transcriptional regulator [Sporobacter termitidis]SHI18054.1 DNA-binding transcriptional regulator, PadR family [Sporobacter termitidis DSM 10068]
MKQTDYVILGLLSEEPLTGYQIKRIIDVRFRFFWNESYGQLYPSLKALCGAGYVKETDADAAQPRAQKAYRLTPQGFEALRGWLALPVEKESMRFEILLKMYFSHLTDPDVMLEHVKKFQAAHEQDLKVLDAFDAELRAIEDDDPAHPTIRRVVDFGRKANGAYLDWCRETTEFLESRWRK